MRNFLVEAYQTGAREPDVVADARVRHVRSIFVPEDELGLHLFAAPSADALRAALAHSAFVYDRIVEASTEASR